MDDTARFESAQALFCAIADLVGKSNIDKVLNLTKYPTYTDFANGHRDPKFKGKSNRDRINLAAKQIDTTADLDTIETFLINNNSWYISTIKIASHLIEFLWKVDADFKSISRKNFLSGKKSIYVIKKINKKDKFTEENIRCVRPSFGLHPKYFNWVLGKKSNINLKPGERLTLKSIIKYE